MSSQPAPDHDGYELDPVFLHSRREAVAILFVWFVCMLWAVPVSYMLGYGRDVTPENVSMVMGMPTWTFWGILVPWLAADVVTTWLCFVYIKDDDLGQADDELPVNEATADGGNA